MPTPDAVEMPMFPLGSVLFPHGFLPLHIFEIRYQQLLNASLESDRRFGVVLITKGHEVGGGDSRSSIGTFARIDEYQRFDDGRAAVATTGTSRLEVVDWLEDDPYPRALVRQLEPDPIEQADEALYIEARQAFDKLVSVGERLGRLAAPPQLEWDDDLAVGAWQLANRSPCTAHDQQAILSATSWADRLARIKQILNELTADLELMGQL